MTKCTALTGSAVKGLIWRTTNASDCQTTSDQNSRRSACTLHLRTDCWSKIPDCRRRRRRNLVKMRGVTRTRNFRIRASLGCTWPP